MRVVEVGGGEEEEVEEEEVEAGADDASQACAHRVPTSCQPLHSLKLFRFADCPPPPPTPPPPTPPPSPPSPPPPSS